MVNETHIARVSGAEEDVDTKRVPHDETKFALMANLYVSEGQKGKVCSERFSINQFLNNHITLYLSLSHSLSLSLLLPISNALCHPRSRSHLRYST